MLYQLNSHGHDISDQNILKKKNKKWSLYNLADHLLVFVIYHLLDHPVSHPVGLENGFAQSILGLWFKGPPAEGWETQALTKKKLMTKALQPL